MKLSLKKTVDRALDLRWPTIVTRIDEGTVGEPIHLIRGANGGVIAFEMIFYGIPRPVEIPAEYLEEV